MKILKETPDYVLVDWCGDGRRSKENKYLCIGGPFNGQKKAYSQVADAKGSYVGYNCADNPRFVRPQFPKKVWVYRTIINKTNELQIPECRQRR